MVGTISELLLLFGVRGLTDDQTSTLQDLGTGDRSSVAVPDWARPGAEVDGLVLETKGGLSLISIKGDVVKARADVDLLPSAGTKVRLRILESGTPVRVRLVSSESQASVQGDRQLTLASMAVRADVLRASQAFSRLFDGLAGYTKDLELPQQHGVGILSAEDTAAGGLKNAIKAASFVVDALSYGGKADPDKVRISFTMATAGGAPGLSSGKFESSPQQLPSLRIVLKNLLDGLAGAKGQDGRVDADGVAVEGHGSEIRTATADIDGIPGRVVQQDPSRTLQTRSQGVYVRAQDGLSQPTGKAGLLDVPSVDAAPNGQAQPSLFEKAPQGIVADGMYVKISSPHLDNQSALSNAPADRAGPLARAVSDIIQAEAGVSGPDVPLKWPGQQVQVKHNAGEKGQEVSQAGRVLDAKGRVRFYFGSDRPSDGARQTTFDDTFDDSRRVGQGHISDAGIDMKDKALEDVADGLKALSSHVDVVQNYQSQVRAHLDIPFFIVPFWFEGGAGLGDVSFWFEGGAEGGPEGRSDGPVSHLIFDLTLRGLGAVMMHVTMGRGLLNMMIAADHDALPRIRADLPELKNALQRLGFRFEISGIIPIDEADQAEFIGPFVEGVGGPGFIDLVT
ncbi:MAG: flagellar hook-length control protein FliK [Dissulfurimicrobium hydrothermale]|uniref:flagellar hook-length control protein FliK n=1 Tax=Dissulfurimicrobium hydrothermale TaxID=1750598 RepID=UPI003C741B4F